MDCLLFSKTYYPALLQLYSFPPGFSASSYEEASLMAKLHSAQHQVDCTALTPKHIHAQRSCQYTFLHMLRGNRTAILHWATGISRISLPKPRPLAALGI